MLQPQCLPDRQEVPVVDVGGDWTKKSVSRREMMLGGVKVTLSVGIAAHVGADTDFSRMYRNADVALNYARVEGKVALASKLRLR